MTLRLNANYLWARLASDIASGSGNATIELRDGATVLAAFVLPQPEVDIQSPGLVFNGQPLLSSASVAQGRVTGIFVLDRDGNDVFDLQPTYDDNDGVDVYCDQQQPSIGSTYVLSGLRVGQGGKSRWPSVQGALVVRDP